MSFFSLHALLRLKKKNIFFCHIHNYTEYNQQWNVFSVFNPSKCTHTWSSGQLTLQLGVWCLAQGSHLSLRQFLPELRFERTTSGYKSNALSIRPRLPLGLIERLRFLISVSSFSGSSLSGESMYLVSFYPVSLLKVACVFSLWSVGAENSGWKYEWQHVSTGRNSLCQVQIKPEFLSYVM